MAQQRNTISIFSAVLAISAAGARCGLIRGKSDDHFECIMQNKANLARPKMNASLIIAKDYENKSAFGVPENKAKQTQFVFFTAENAKYAEMKNICVSDCPIEKYALYPVSACSLRTRRLMKNKANQSQFQTTEDRGQKSDDRNLPRLSRARSRGVQPSGCGMTGRIKAQFIARGTFSANIEQSRKLQ
jgi:hypothetical protein